MDWRDKKVLVTGAGGFIGSHLCEALIARGARLTALVRYTSSAHWGNLEFLPEESKGRLEVVAGNIEDGDFVARVMREKEFVFHLGALIAIPYSYVAPRSYLRTNAEGTLNVLEAARQLGTRRVIHTSTSETYGTALYTPIDEAHPLQGQSPYSASKIAADKLVESYHLSFGLPVTTLRPFNTFGPRQSARAVIPTIITQALTQDEVRLGALEPVRDLTFVTDTVEGFLKIAGCDQAIGQTINIGAGKGLTIGALATLILSLLGVVKPVVADSQRFRPNASEVYTLICNRTKALETIGWSPAVGLREGLRQTIDFVSRNLAHYKPSRYAL